MPRGRHGVMRWGVFLIMTGQLPRGWAAVAHWLLALGQLPVSSGVLTVSIATWLLAELLLRVCISNQLPGDASAAVESTEPSEVLQGRGRRVPLSPSSSDRVWRRLPWSPDLPFK